MLISRVPFPLFEPSAYVAYITTLRGENVSLRGIDHYPTWGEPLPDWLLSLGTPCLTLQHVARVQGDVRCLLHAGASVRGEARRVRKT